MPCGGPPVSVRLPIKMPNGMTLDSPRNYIEFDVTKKITRPPLNVVLLQARG